MHLTFGLNSALAGSLSWASIRALSISDRCLMHLLALDISWHPLISELIYLSWVMSYVICHTTKVLESQPMTSLCPSSLSLPGGLGPCDFFFLFSAEDVLIENEAFQELKDEDLWSADKFMARKFFKQLKRNSSRLWSKEAFKICYVKVIFKSWFVIRSVNEDCF